jgi:4-amino-4-deoxy-L-arabinose transferase-like glycosyltransferase
MRNLMPRAVAAPDPQSSADPAAPGAQLFSRSAMAELRIAWALALAAVLIHFATNLGLGGYGYFRDELYYIACSRHLALGYVDHPALSIVLLWIELHLFGASMFALRIFPALAHGAAVIVVAMLAREMGGRRFAMSIAALATLVAPIYLGVGAFYSMNAYEPLLWALAALVLVRILNTGNARLWLWFGVIAGVGLENKISMLFLCFGVVIGLMLSDQRRQLLSPWLWIGGAIAMLLFLPYVIWNAEHGFPTLAFIHNAQELKNYHASIPGFFAAQIVLLNPLSAPLWLAGLAWCLFAADGRRYRVLGWAYLTVFMLLALQGGKAYYAAPVYVLMFAAGAVALERFAALRRSGRLVRPVSAIALVIGAVISAPLAIPMLPPAMLADYAGFFGMGPAQRQAVMGERNEQGALPQNFADRFGWPELTAAVAQVYDSIPAGERAHVTIFAGNYGEAGALDFFGPRYGLPTAISSHNNYWFWGFGDPAIDSMIVVGVPRARLEQVFGEVTPVARVTCRYCVAMENNRDIYVCRGLKTPIAKLWPRLKNFI